MTYLDKTAIFYFAASTDGIIGYSIFRGNSFIKIPVRYSSVLNIKLVFFPISPNGILIFVKGETAGSYIYLVLIKGTLKACLSSSKKKKCEDILNINVSCVVMDLIVNRLSL